MVLQGLSVLFWASASRKRKKGGLVLEPDEKEEEKAQESEEEEEDNLKQAEKDREEEEKKKEDALWASFLSDVGQKPKAAVATQADKVPGPSPRGCVWEGPEVGKCWFWLVEGMDLLLPHLFCKPGAPLGAQLVAFQPGRSVV